jgi:hypothetical protein
MRRKTGVQCESFDVAEIVRHRKQSNAIATARKIKRRAAKRGKWGFKSNNVISQYGG